MDANANVADAFGPSADVWTRLGLGDAPAALGQAWMQEVTQFLAQRLRADADALLALGTCTRPAEMAEVQHRWLLEMGEAYASVGARMMRLAVPPAGDPPRAAG